MARDHFQDIIPPEQSRPHTNPEQPMEDDAGDEHTLTVASTDKSIRNINITRRAVPADPGRSAPSVARSKIWLWILATICVVVLVVLAVLYAFRKTTVIVTPQVQPVVFDQTMQYTAYPSGSAATGTLQYQVHTTDLTDSEAVSASGTTHKETKASGSIIVENDYSTAAIKLLKTTRFETPSGLIFRAPDAVVIPGKQGSIPGKVTITVIADTAGDQYNIGQGQKMILPGLKGSPVMYGAIYAMTAASTTGGFLGNAPSVSDSDIAAAHASIESRLQKKALEFATAATEGGVAFKPEMSFTSDPLTGAQNGQATVVEHAHVVVASISPEQLAHAVAQTVTASASAINYTLAPTSGFSASIVGNTPNIGTDPITFSMQGNAALIAIVDTGQLAQSLAGRDKNAFEAIARNFPGVESARAIVEPFWQTAFPTNPTDIHITVVQPQQ